MLKNSLGRGLGSLIPNLSDFPADASGSAGFTSAEDREAIAKIPLEQIEKNPWQPREHFAHSDMEDLVESVKKHGILQPLIVTKTASSYQLIAGERRLEAARILGLKAVPAIVRSAQNLEKLEIALIENLQRQDLNPIEEAAAYQRLIDEFNLTQEEVALRVGKKRATVANALRMLTLPQEIKTALKEGRITPGHAKVILEMESASARLKLFEKILAATLTVAGASAEVRKIKVKSHERVLSKDPETAAAEDRLRKALGTKVTINKKNGSGQIVIDFYAAEELAALVVKLAKED